IRRRHHDVAAVVQNVRGLAIRGDATELEILRDADRTADFTLDADVPIEIHGHRAAEVVVTETRFVGIGVLGEPHAASGDDADFNASGARPDFLCERGARSDAHESGHCEYSKQALHTSLLEWF